MEQQKEIKARKDATFMDPKPFKDSIFLNCPEAGAYSKFHSYKQSTKGETTTTASQPVELYKANTMFTFVRRAALWTMCIQIVAHQYAFYLVLEIQQKATKQVFRAAQIAKRLKP